MNALDTADGMNMMAFHSVASTVTYFPQTRAWNGFIGKRGCLSLVTTGLFAYILRRMFMFMSTVGDQ